MFKDNEQLKALKLALQQKKVSNQNSSETNLLSGLVKAKSGGYGFVTTNRSKSYYIDHETMNNLLPGQMVEFTVEISKQSNKEKSLVKKIIKNPYVTIYAQVVKDNLFQFIHSELCKTITFTNPQAIIYQEGDWCEFNLLDQSGKLSLDYQLSYNIGASNAPYIEQQVACRKFKISQPFEDDQQFTLQQQASIDLTAIPFYTIDGAGTQDIDDAIYIQGNKLYVAIADPSSYIEEGSEFEQITAKRITSVYLPGMTIPMLASKYSNHLCSLLQGELKQALVAEIELFADRRPQLRQLLHALIKPVVNLNYDEVSEFLQNNNSEQQDGTKFLPSLVDLSIEQQQSVQQSLTELHQFYLIGRRWRQANAVINSHEKGDYKFIYKNDKFDTIHHLPWQLSNKIVEEVILTANYCLACYGKQHNLPLLYTSQSGLKHELRQRVEEYNNYLKQLQIIDRDYDLKNINDFSAYLRKLGMTKYRSRVMRFMAPSSLSLDSNSHFGLGLDCYLTWTSPIRKYSDLYNHRVLLAHLYNKTLPVLPAEYLDYLCERKGFDKQAERQVENSLYVQFFMRVENQTKVFQATVNGCNRYALQILIDEIGVKGTLPIQSLVADLDYQVDPNTFELSWNENNQTKTLSLLDKIQVKFDHIEKNSEEIFFTLSK